MNVRFEVEISQRGFADGDLRVWLRQIIADFRSRSVWDDLSEKFMKY